MSVVGIPISTMPVGARQSVRRQAKSNGGKIAKNCQTAKNCETLRLSSPPHGLQGAV